MKDGKWRLVTVIYIAAAKVRQRSSTAKRLNEGEFVADAGDVPTLPPRDRENEPRLSRRGIERHCPIYDLSVVTCTPYAYMHARERDNAVQLGRCIMQFSVRPLYF